MTTRLYLREEGSPASADSILVSRDPQAGAITMGRDDGLVPVAICHTFFASDAADGQTEAALYGPAEDGRFVVPQGWIARLYLITFYVLRNSTDIANASVKLFVDGVDVSADWGALAVVTHATDPVFTSAVPTAAPYAIDASAALKSFSMKYTTDGTSGVVVMQAQVMGHMYKAV